MNEKLLELCVDIYAHVELDMELTLEGNGTNPLEASHVADAILSIFGIETSSLWDMIKKRMAELEEE